MKRRREIKKSLTSKMRVIRNLSGAEFASEYAAEVGGRWRDRQLLRAARQGSNCWLEGPDCREPMVTKKDCYVEQTAAPIGAVCSVSASPDVREH